MIFETSDAPTRARELSERGIDIGALDDRRIRAVTHMEVDRAGVETALRVMREVFGA